MPAQRGELKPGVAALEMEFPQLAGSPVVHPMGAEARPVGMRTSPSRVPGIKLSLSRHALHGDVPYKEQKLAADFCDGLGKPCNIAELTKERLRRAAKKIKDENPMSAGDLGFRVFKLGSSNIRAWQPDPGDLPMTLQKSIEHLDPERSEADILLELLLKLGLDLTVPIEEKAIAGRTVHSVGAGTLLVCLAPQITADEVEPLALGIAAWHRELATAGETLVVFRDSAFADDVAKSNLTAILQQHGLENVRSL